MNKIKYVKVFASLLNLTVKIKRWSQKNEYCL